MDGESTIVDQSVPVCYLRLKEVEHRTGLGRSTIYDRIKKKTFPAQVKLGGSKSVGWSEIEINEHIANWGDARPKSAAESEISHGSPSRPELHAPASRCVPVQVVPSRKPERSQKPKGKSTFKEKGLIPTDVKIAGCDEVYVQTETGKLFGEIGQLPPSLLAVVVAQQGVDGM